MKLRAYSCPICDRPSAHLPKRATRAPLLWSFLTLGLARAVTNKRFCPCCLIEFTEYSLFGGIRVRKEVPPPRSCELAPETASMRSADKRADPNANISSEAELSPRDSDPNSEDNFESRFLRVLEDLLYLMDTRKPKETSRISSTAQSILQSRPAPVLQLKKRG